MGAFTRCARRLRVLPALDFFRAPRCRCSADSVTIRTRTGATMAHFSRGTMTTDRLHLQSWTRRAYQPTSLVTRCRGWSHIPAGRAQETLPMRRHRNPELNQKSASGLRQELNSLHSAPMYPHGVLSSSSYVVYVDNQASVTVTYIEQVRRSRGRRHCAIGPFAI